MIGVTQYTMTNVSQNSKALQIFSYEGNSVRTILDEHGDPWWVAKDVCSILEIKDVSNAVNGNPSRNEEGLDEDERDTYSVSTPGGKQKMLCVNEYGLYSLVFKSRKPEAKAFKRWITHEVIPSIRKTGSYSVPNEEKPRPQFNFKYQERLHLNRNVRIYGYFPVTKFFDDINSQFLEDVVILSETSSPDISLGRFLASRLPLEPWYDVEKVKKPVGGYDRSKWDHDIIMTVYVSKDGYPVKREVTFYPLEWYPASWHIVQNEYFADLFPKYLGKAYKGVVRCADEAMRKYIAERVNYFIDR